MAFASARFPALGTTAQVTVLEPDALEDAVAVVEAQLEALDLACSRFRGDSELSALNRSAGRPFRASALLIDALATAVAAAKQTDGDVDPTVGRAINGLGWDRDFTIVVSRGERSSIEVVPAAGWDSISIDHELGVVCVPRGAEVDLGATAKAFCADRCAARVAERRGVGTLINLGGDVSIAGVVPDGGWAIRVADDHCADSDAPGQTIALLSGGLATSSTTVRRWRAGGAERHHIVDPRTGLPASEVWRTVSVAAQSCVAANTATTAAIVRGRAALGWLDDLGLPARLVSREGSVSTTSWWPGAPR